MLSSVEISADRVRPSGEEKAHLAVCDQLIGFVDDHHLISGAHRSTLRVTLDVDRIVKRGEVEQAFGHTEHLLHCASE